MNIGLLGLGTIGSGIYEHLLKRDDIHVKRILELLRHPGLEHLETSDYGEILNDPEIDTVIELIGGMEPAHTFTVQALKAGKNVVSANKLMLSHHMEEILTLAREMEARCLTFLNQRGDLPTETELWQLMIREHPDWFQLVVLPVQRQLFTRLTTDIE